jgi:oxygen-dependent protoporphyrinogen oxidase
MLSDLDVAVVGAGVAGLTVAYRLQQAGRSVHVFEAADAVGGRMRTRRQDGHVIDTGAEMLSTQGYEATWRLARQLGLTGADIAPLDNPIALWRDGRAHGNVGRPLGLVTGGGLSWHARLDLTRFNASVVLRRRRFDPDHPEDTPFGDATLAAVCDRYGTELRDYLLEPLAGGFFGWEITRSAAAPMACLLLATGSTTHWRTYREGMDTLPRRLAQRLDVRTGHRVEEVVASDAVARLVVDGAAATARTVVLSMPAPTARLLYANAPDDERRYLEACTFAPMLRVTCVLDERPALPGRDGSAYIIALPRAENEVLSGFTLDHNKPGRAPGGRGLVSLLTRPPVTRDLIDAPDDDIVGCVTAQGERYLPGLQRSIRGCIVSRFRHGLPEATPGALRLRRSFVGRPARTVEYAGDWLMLRPNSEGAVRSGELAFRRVQARHGAVPRPVSESVRP